MTQTYSNQTLWLQLTPMQLPEATPAAAGELKDIRDVELSAAGMSLILYPGEPSEMLVQMENRGSHILHLDLHVEGNFPAEWCHLGGMEGSELAPRQRMEAVLRFRIPPNFFEDPAALDSTESLILNYQSSLYVYYGEAGRQQVEPVTFNLLVRPRSLYLDFIPTLYREVDAVGRFLKIFEQTFEPAVQTMDVLWAYLDPLTAPQTLLPFLSRWVAWPLDPRVDLATGRRLIKSAMEIYRWRGTRRGLRLYLHLVTGLPLDDDSEEADKHIAFVDSYSRGFRLESTHLGQDSTLGRGRAYHFIIRLRPDRPDQIDEALVRQIVDQEKPAFCTYELYIENPSG